MKYLILPLDGQRIIHISDDLGYQENGNYLINGGKMAVPTSICQLAEVETVPAEIVEEKYCYSAADGFYANPDWAEPVDTVDAILNELEDELNA